MRRHKVKGRRLRLSVWQRVFVLLLAVMIPTVAVYFRIRPVVTEYAESRARMLAEQTANETVAAVLLEQEELCRTMIKVTYNANSILSSVIADAAAVNRIKTAVATATLEKLRNLSSLEISVPLGTLIGPDWLSGWGPEVQFPIGVTARVLTTVSSSLEAVGINQSAYRVLLHVHISLAVITPDGRSSVTVDSAFPMAETVLLGEVPDTLTEVYGDDQTLLGKIFDYGTTE